MTGFPKPLTELFEEDALKLSYSGLLAKCDEVYNYVFTSDEAKLVKCHTREQSKSRIWFQQRSGRVTASKLKSAISTGYYTRSQKASLASVIKQADITPHV